jgi:hypothetical protein
MKTNAFGKTLLFALLISASSMIVSCAAGEGEGETTATDTTAVAPVTPEEPVITEETTVVDTAASASTVDSTVAQ